jgi:hypothetical protein
MSTYVIHPVWPVKNPHQLEYGLYRVCHHSEYELLRSVSFERIEAVWLQLRHKRDGQLRA